MKFLNIVHLPTWMLIIGYPMYWLELHAFKIGRGVTSWGAWTVLIAVAVILFYNDKKEIKASFLTFKGWLKNLPLFDRWLITAGVSLATVILVVAGYAWFLPLHLIQESDFMTYHVMLPRQHLIRGSFEFIPWSPFDLFLLPIDYAIAPFGLATAFPNKIPQLIFFIGLLLVVVELMNRKPFPAVFMLLLIFGSHGMGIQMGTAMLDLAVAYLLLAAWDSLRRGMIFLFLVEFCFYFWAKPFIPLQTILIAGGLCAVFGLFKFFKSKRVEILPGEELKFSFRQSKQLLIKGVVGFLALSAVVAGPFIAKSLYHAGTPLFPFGPGALMINKDIDRSSKHWNSIEETSRVVTERGMGYGYGRGIDAFVKHCWLLAVPDAGVNNRYDYPAGLPFLLVLLPFFYLFVKGIRDGTFNIVHWFTVFYWALWWMTSQQMRFLYISILLMFLAVIFDTKILSRSLLFCILMALALNTWSVLRAHKMDFGKSHEDMLRPGDRALVQLSREYVQSGQTGSVVLGYDYGDVAFAQFPVIIKKEHPPYILATD